MSETPRLRIFFTGIGGQGIVFSSKVLGEAVLLADLNVVMSEVHGMAQRGGVVTSQICIGDAHGPLIADGDADVIVAFEPVEAYRFIHKANADTMIITNTEPLEPSTANFGDVEYPDTVEVLQAIREVTQNLITVKGSSIANELGSPHVLNSIFLGALAGTGRLPIEPQKLREHLLTKVPKKIAELNAKAFDAGLAAVSG
jgi:indolepyruvate ferredoxin oxidoreductase beta subunit